MRTPEHFPDVRGVESDESVLSSGPSRQDSPSHLPPTRTVGGAPTDPPSGLPTGVGGGTSSVFDHYCEECFGAFAVWRPHLRRTLCEDHARVSPELCWECQQALAAVLDPRDGYPKCGSCVNRRLEEAH